MAEVKVAGLRIAGIDGAGRAVGCDEVGLVGAESTTPRSVGDELLLANCLGWELRWLRA